MSSQTKSEFVYDTIKELITSGKWVPGQRYSAIEIADTLGISRTPVNEAIKQLTVEGFVKLLPNKGFEVRRLSLKEIEELLQIRAVLEGLAAYKAAQNITPNDFFALNNILEKHEQSISNKDFESAERTNEELHFMIHQLADSPYLQKTLYDLWGHGNWYWKKIINDSEKLLTSFTEHRELVEAIIGKQPIKARQIAEDHISKFHQEIIATLNEKFTGNPSELNLYGMKNALLTRMQFSSS